MKIARKISSLKKEIKRIKLMHKSIGLVPTMGALHDGHLSLMRQARKDNDFVIVSIFINPVQFGPKEDFNKYPRDLRRDVRLCAKIGTDTLFYPNPKDMYPQDYKTYVGVEGLGDVLCGKSRPGHFRGVATVVAKLFNIVQPNVAYFGQKDAQQAIIIKKMSQDLNMSLKIRVMPTIREKDGLAMSSRNVYLNKEERNEAIVLSSALALAKKLIQSGVRDSAKIIRKMTVLIKTKKRACIDYVDIVGLDNLEPVKTIRDKALVALAVYIGKTRLIDNIIVNKH